MRSSFFRASAAIAILAAGLPFMASAHEHHNYEIGKKTYIFTVGSLNEPVVVDDKTGVELAVEELKGNPVEGLDQTLKVEISAGDKKRVLDLAPQYGKPGTYKAPFYPTVRTTLTYRFFGTVNGVPIDLSFTCNSAGHPMSHDDDSRVEISESVVRTHKGGAFGCPMAKTDLGFPEPSVSLAELSADADDGSDAMIMKQIALAKTKSVIALIASAVALVIALSIRKKTK